MPRALVTFFCLQLLTFSLSAHQTSDAYLSVQLTNSQLMGRLSIALRDLNHVLTLDPDNDGEISDPELEKAKPLIQKLSYERVRFFL